MLYEWSMHVHMKSVEEADNTCGMKWSIYVHMKSVEEAAKEAYNACGMNGQYMCI